MYLQNDDSYTYHQNGQQRHSQGSFLLLVTPEEEMGVSADTMRACVRQVALEQFGHHMMGTARIGGESFTVDGTYGNKGLPIDVPREIWEQYCEPVPEDLYEQWKHGGGHNSAGDEAKDLRQWALNNLDALTPA